MPQNLKGALDESAFVLDLISRKTLPPPEQKRVIEESVRYWKENVNPAFLEYRKSVSTDYTAVEWSDEGSVFRDVQGKEFLDMLGGFGIYVTGHRHPKVLKAVKEQLDKQAIHSQELIDPLRTYLAHLVSHDHARRPPVRVLHELRDGIGRGVPEDGDPDDRPASLRRDDRRLPRQVPGVARRDLQGGLPRAVPAAQALDPRAVRRRGRAAHGRRERRLLRRPGRGRRDRADPGRGRDQRRAARLPRRGARDLRQVRRPARLRRGPERHGPNRKDVLLRARRRRAGPLGPRQGLRRRRHADRRLRGNAAHVGEVHRQPVSAHDDLRRQSRLLRRGDRDDPRAPRGGPAEAGGREGRVPAAAHERARQPAPEGDEGGARPRPHARHGVPEPRPRLRGREEPLRTRRSRSRGRTSTPRSSASSRR